MDYPAIYKSQLPQLVVQALKLLKLIKILIFLPISAVLIPTY